jgi:hypothetical protein
MTGKIRGFFTPFRMTGKVQGFFSSLRMTCEMPGFFPFGKLRVTVTNVYLGNNSGFIEVE